LSSSDPIALKRHGQLDALNAGVHHTGVAFEARRRVVGALSLASGAHPSAKAEARGAAEFARAQGAFLWARLGDIVASCADPSADPSPTVVNLATADPAVISMAAERLIPRLADCSEAALGAIGNEVALRPERWRDCLRDGVRLEDQTSRHIAAEMLLMIGEQQDVRLLRDQGNVRHDRFLAAKARDLARRLAQRVVVEDLGRVRILIGPQSIEGSDIRRKVLSLLCFLLTKARHAASREEAIDALWPEQEPDAAMNSLNQTVYFLRRVFEPAYREEVSPGYVHQDGESLWLDPELITSRSNTCRDLVRRAATGPLQDVAAALAREYHGPFALDFPYEEWATSFRDSLHAPFLRVMEHAIRADIDAGDFGRGIELAERVHEVDSESEEIQIALVRLYRLSGALAAAADQYERYAAGVRELGLEPASLAEL
jgi:DNA-binding SARP family transcriptional activator